MFHPKQSQIELLIVVMSTVCVRAYPHIEQENPQQICEKHLASPEHYDIFYGLKGAALPHGGLEVQATVEFSDQGIF